MGRHQDTFEGVQLYNLEEDPGETQNLEATHPKVIHQLVDELATALHEGRTTPGKKQANDGWPYQDEATLTGFSQRRER